MTSVAVTQASNPPVQIRAGMAVVKLNPQQQRQWSETLAACNWIGPGFVHLIYTMMVLEDGIQVALFTEDIPCAAATDGNHLMFKPSEFFALTLMERVFAVFHEVSHCVGDHCGMGYQMKKRGEIICGNKKLLFDPMHANIVQDYIINDMLIESQFGQFKKGWLWDKSIATYMDDWVEVYFKTYKTPGKNPNGPGKGPAGKGTQPSNDPDKQTDPAPGQFDQHLDPGQSEGKTPEEMGPRDVQAWQQAVAGALEVARSMGKCPAAFEQHFGAMLEPKVDWAEHLKALIARKVGSGGYDFRRPDRRLIVRDIVAPGRSGHGAGIVVLGLDTSGSIFVDPTLINRWMAELTGIMQDLRPREVHVVECDAAVQRVTVMTDASDISELQVLKGGGGTDFNPVFDYVEQEDLTPDCLLYLTDGYGEFPKQAPRYAVIWGNISGKNATYPWGDVVEVPTE
jgi:predicted metal-dependent peptidase